jgi:pimeloyl-ACP methyl ester carboxylesterase
MSTTGPSEAARPDNPRGAGQVLPLDSAMLRAYTPERCIDYGCRPEDARALHAGVAAGSPWLDLACGLGEAQEAQALQAQPQDLEQARRALLAASACYRVGQPALEDALVRRLALYRRATAAFGRALAADDAACPLQTRHEGRVHGGWLFPAPRAQARPGCVVIWGGADGWGEAFHGWVPGLHALGLAVCLTELPGQGLARLQEGAHLTRRYTGMVSALLDALSVALGPAAGRFALIGNSLGGSLALRAAADDARVAACVTNGGSLDPVSAMAAFPRGARRLCAMLGDSATPGDAQRFMAGLDLPGAARAMPAALLCVHGGQDPLVPDSEVARLQAARPDLTLLRWDDGVHCVYNHAAERNTRVARWIAPHLGVEAAVP